MARAPLLGALAVALALGVAAAAADTGRVVFTDPLAGTVAQHSSVVEPDTFSAGQTIVSAFQVGRIDGGGAAAIGWATSPDSGRTWRSGLLPGLTAATGDGGPYARASDPSVAYDAAHGVWLVSTLGLGDEDVPDGPVSSLAVSRSADGLAWGAPITVSPPVGRFAHDKNWVVCDNWPSSPFRGRCYTAWSGTEAAASVAVSRSVDGGVTWSEPSLAPAVRAVGVQPVVRPDGVLVVPYLTGGELESVRSVDGGVTWEAPAVVAAVLFSPVARLRAAPLPSVEVAGDGRIWMAWSDCLLNAPCRPGRTTNAVALASSADGRSWTKPVRVPVGARGRLDYVMPGIAVDPASAGRRTRLAVVAYTLGPACDQETCAVTARTVLSANAGESWTRPIAFRARGRLADAPRSGPLRMLGDYLSASWTTGPTAVSVATLPVAPFDGAYHVALVAGRFEAPASTLLDLVPRRPLAGRLLRVTLDVHPAPASRRVACVARSRGRALAVTTRMIGGTRATCAWRVPRSASGRLVSGTVSVGPLRRTFSVRVAGNATARR